MAVALPLLVATLGVVCLTQLVEANAQAQSPGRSASSWTTGNRITLKVASKGEPGSVRYGFLITAKGDMRININKQSGAERPSGTILLISGRAMAIRGLKLEPGYEIDTVDAAGLSWQLASQLLERGAPGDPRELKQSVQIDVLEKKDPVSVSTTTASGSYPPPWTANGTATPLGGGRVAFDVAFGFTAPGTPTKPYRLMYSGIWEQSEPAPVIEDMMSLKGWEIHLIGPIRRSDAGGQILDYGASPTQSRYATVADLRQAVAEKK